MLTLMRALVAVVVYGVLILVTLLLPGASAFVTTNYPLLFLLIIVLIVDAGTSARKRIGPFVLLAAAALALSVIVSAVLWAVTDNAATMDPLLEEQVPWTSSAVLIIFALVSRMLAHTFVRRRRPERESS